MKLYCDYTLALSFLCRDGSRFYLFRIILYNEKEEKYGIFLIKECLPYSILQH